MPPKAGGGGWTSAPSNPGALAEHPAQQDERRRHWGAEWAAQDLVFTTDKGRRQGWRDVDRDFKLRVAKAGTKAIRFHDLRHTNATLQFEARMHYKGVQERLGHSDIGVTLDIRSHVTLTLGRDAAQRLDRVFDGDAAGDRGEADGMLGSRRQRARAAILTHEGSEAPRGLSTVRAFANSLPLFLSPTRTVGRRPRKAHPEMAWEAALHSAGPGRPGRCP